MFKLEERTLLAPVAHKKPIIKKEEGKDSRKREEKKEKPDEVPPPEVTSQQKSAYIKVMWNLVASADVIYGIAREQRQVDSGGSGTFLNASELKIMKRLLLHGCEVIHGISELRPTQDCTRTVDLLAELFKKLRPL